MYNEIGAYSIVKIDLSICVKCPMHRVQMRWRDDKPLKPDNACKIKLMHSKNHKKYGGGWIEPGGWVPRQCYMRMEYMVLQQEEEIC